ncbi:hypothetical protein [Granulicella sp. L60]|uniref:hypothetical protein n=1 Tax=Granulicella sp. L60 TaxID=1641866 RepID=UPI00131B44AA|nr:hypothetical protein [Granulicella sp. L60]
MIELATGTAVDGIIFDDVTLEHFIESQAKWRPLVVEAAKKMQASGTPTDQLPRHWHWNWERKEQQLGDIGLSFFGIECRGELQGLMKVDLAKYSAKIPTQARAELAYIDYLEAAPWNIRELAEANGHPPRFGTVGLNLFAAAIGLSLEVGYEGRVGLHSLPNPRTERFYENTCKMIPVHRDPSMSNLLYLETTPVQAQLFLSEAQR